MTLIAIEEHWILQELTAALRAMPVPDESLAFNEMGDHQQRPRRPGCRPDRRPWTLRASTCRSSP